jgi:superfamily I DNA/RNA helicase
VQPTDEQKAVLDSTGRVVRINARAGTGKTTTLRLLSEAHSAKKILYLVFNRKAREEAQSRFPSNVNIKTVHSLAWAGTGKDYEVGDFSPKDLLPYFQGRVNPQLHAKVCHDFLVFFMNSAHAKMEEATADFQKVLPQEVREIFNRNQKSVVEAARSIATTWYRKERPCPHDFYLKMFHNEGLFDRALDRYDMILVDEAQDLSGVMVDALIKCRRRVFVVGDTHQQIYGFRYAVDAMRKLSADEDLELTLSFRFGKSVADLASLLIREAKGEGAFRILGNPQKTSTVMLSDAPPRKRCALLTRTNLSLFSHAMALRSKNARFRFERDIEKVLWQTLDVYWLANGKTSEIRNDWIKTFKDIRSLDDYAEKCEDFSLKGMSQIVRKYSSDFPGAIFDMATVNRGDTGGRCEDDVVLSTIHASKGQEFERVHVDSDVAENMTAALESDGDRYNEEVNVAYVGFTRALHSLSLSSSFEDLLGPKWKQHLRKCKMAAASADGNMSPRSSSTTVRHWQRPPSGKVPSVRNPQRSSRPVAPPKRQVLVGCGVKTPHGTGTVVEVSGDQCLVDLDGQLANVWERTSSVQVLNETQQR